MRAVVLFVALAVAVSAADVRRQYAAQGSLLAAKAMCPGTGTCCTGPGGASVCPHVGGVCCVNSGFCCPASFQCHMYNGQASCVKAVGTLPAGGRPALSQPLFQQEQAQGQAPGTPGQYMVVEKRPDGTVVTTISKTKPPPPCPDEDCDESCSDSDSCSGSGSGSGSGSSSGSGSGSGSGGSSGGSSGSSSAGDAITASGAAMEKSMTASEKSKELADAAKKNPTGPPPPMPAQGGASGKDDPNAPAGGPSISSSGIGGAASIASPGSRGTTEHRGPGASGGVDPAIAKKIEKDNAQDRKALGLKKGDVVRKGENQKNNPRLRKITGSGAGDSDSGSGSGGDSAGSSSEKRRPVKNHLKLNNKVEITLGKKSSGD